VRFRRKVFQSRVIGKKKRSGRRAAALASRALKDMAYALDVGSVGPARLLADLATLGRKPRFPLLMLWPSHGSLLEDPNRIGIDPSLRKDRT
jgi:hypothetical protein